MVFILFNIHNVTIILYLNCPPLLPAHSLASVKLFKLSFFPFDVCMLFFRPFLSGAKRCPRTILLFSLPSLEMTYTGGRYLKIKIWLLGVFESVEIQLPTSPHLPNTHIHIHINVCIFLYLYISKAIGSQF